jgi:hypothetical protein
VSKVVAKSFWLDLFTAVHLLVWDRCVASAGSLAESLKRSSEMRNTIKLKDGK